MYGVRYKIGVFKVLGSILSIKKLSLKSNYESIEASLEPAGITLLLTSFADTVQVMNLPLHHRDQFDRIPIAQAIDLSLACFDLNPPIIPFDSTSVNL